MAPILDLIKKNAVPVNVMRSAAKGALPLSAGEMLEILVYLAKNPIFGQEARMTLAKWDAESAIEVLAVETTPAEVLIYYWQEENRRLSLMPALIENAAIPENSLIELAAHAPREIVNLLLASRRARESAGVAEALLANEHLPPLERQRLEAIKEAQPGTALPDTASRVAAPDASNEEAALDTSSEEAADPEAEAAHRAFQQEHAGEIAAAEGKPFELAAEEPEGEKAVGEAASPQTSSEAEEGQDPAEAVPEQALAGSLAGGADAVETEEQKSLTILQKISKMNVGQRIKLGFIGNKEERAILVRDTAKLVQNAVLQSPKLTDPEVELFAGSKNLQENVFREIARQRRFVKLYPVVRNLVNNPRCPLDISLTLVKTLMVYDLKSLRHNKNVPDTIRKMAAKLYQDKATRGGAKKE